MKILVTGGCGYIGSHVARQLLEKGHTVHIIDNLSNGFLANLPPNAIFHELDLADKLYLDTLFGRESFQAVLHFAASIAVGESVELPLKYYQNNVCNTLSLLHLVHKHNVPSFIFSSTAAVYATTDGRNLITEDSPKAPNSPYGWSKLFSEQILQDFAHTSSTRYIILRYFNVAGADPLGRMGQRQPAATHLIKTALQVANGKRNKISIYGTDYPTKDGTGVRDYIHIEDLANAHVVALDYLTQNPQAPSDIFNVGYGRGYSVREVLQAVKDVTQINITSEETARRPGDAVELVADSSKIKKIGWTPRYDNLHKIIEDAWNFEKTLSH